MWQLLFIDIITIKVYNLGKENQENKESGEDKMLAKVNHTEDYPIQCKIINISAKRQITIPQKFFSKLGFGTEAECILRGNEIVIKPANMNYERNTGEFDREILADLIKQGYSGEELLERFKEAQMQVRSAVEHILEQASMVAEGRADYYTDKDVFDEE